MTRPDQGKTHFGFETIDASTKAQRVGEVFSSVARRYDLMNDVMSAGIHHVWKNRMLDILAPTLGHHLLDVAGGTGDITFRYKKKTGGLVTVCDLNQAMLTEGKRRSVDMNMWQGIEWVCGNAESLPFPDQSFDYYTIAFGIRNVTHIDKALAEAYRVLKPGGKFVCLEFSKVTNPVLAKVYDLYSFKIIPHLGKLLANDSASYQYLVESIRQFPPQEKFAEMIRKAGFSQVQYENLTGGIVAIHSGWRT
jgi:ubiquinone/menaquinone biosynthesis methyltransferase